MKHTFAAAIAAALMMLSSCSMWNKVVGAGDASQKSSDPVSVTVDGKTHKNKKAPSIATNPVPANQLGTMPTTDELCGGQWTIASVGDKQIVAEDDAPYINFDSKGRFYASDGCNIVNGDYTFRSDGKVTFSNVLSTMKYCPDVEYAPMVGQIFATESPYSVNCKTIGQETYLYLRNADNKAVATFRRHNMEFLNGAWRVASIDGKKINDEEANIFIDIAELKVHGNTGCNYFNGAIYIDPNRSNAIDFSNMGLTRMACPKGDQERMMMVALEEASSAIAGKNADTVILLNAAGKELMTLKRTESTEQQ